MQTKMATGGEDAKKQSTRIKSYKTRGLDVEEVRRRKEEEGVQLRKSKREEQLSKRRNLLQVADYEDSPEPQFAFPDDTPLEVLAKALYTDNVKQKIAATAKFRKVLSVFGTNPPIADVIDTGCMPKFVEFLSDSSSPVLQAEDSSEGLVKVAMRKKFEAAWVLTNIASGSSLQTRQVIDAGSVPHLIQLLHSEHETVKDQAVWALGNIAGDSPECRDIVLSFSILDPLSELLASPQLDLNTKRNASWTLSNLCRGKNPPPNTELVMKCIPTLAKLLYSDDADVLSHCCWSVAFLADGPNHKIQRIVDGGLCKRMVELLVHPNKKVVSPALRAVGNVLTGDDVQTQVMINCSVLPALQHLLAITQESLQKEACWAISNITAGNRVQIQSVIDCNVFPMLIEIMNSAAEYKTRKEAAWAILNATSGGTAQQIRYLVSVGCIKPLCDMLTVQDSRVVLITIEGLENILRVGQTDAAKNNGVNPFSVLIEEAYGLDKLEYLQNHPSEQIYRLAYRIIEKFFSDDDEVDSSVDPKKSEDGGQFVFNSNSHPPDGGFNF